MISITKSRIFISLPNAVITAMDEALEDIRKSGIKKYPIPEGKGLVTRSSMIESLIRGWLITEWKRVLYEERKSRKERLYARIQHLRQAFSGAKPTQAQINELKAMEEEFNGIPDDHHIPGKVF